jgi:hypothetical protein
MSITTAIADNNSCWSAIRTHFNQETGTETNLRAWNVEICAPRIKEKRCNEFSGGVLFLSKPFSRVICLLSSRSTGPYTKIWFTRGEKI